MQQKVIVLALYFYSQEINIGSMDAYSIKLIYKTFCMVLLPYSVSELQYPFNVVCLNSISLFFLFLKMYIIA